MSDLFKTSYATKITETFTTDLEGVGTLRWFGGKLYRWVLYNNGTGNLTPATGDMLGYHVAADATYHTVTDDMSDASTKVVAGQIDGTNSAVPADAEYFWMLIKGTSEIMSVDGSGTPVAGGGLAYGTTDKAAAKAVTLLPTFGMWLDVTGSAMIAILDCPESI